MPVSNLNRQEMFTVRPAHVKTWLTPETMSPLGQALFALAKEIEESDEPAFDDTALEQELKRRRGGYDFDEQ